MNKSNDDGNDDSNDDINDIYPIAFQKSALVGGSLKWKDNEIKSDSDNKQTLLRDWNTYLETFLQSISNEYLSKLDDNDKNFKFSYIEDIDSLVLVDTSTSSYDFSIEEGKKDSLKFYSPDINNYIPSMAQQKIITKLVPWVKIKLTIDLLFNTLYDYKTLAESWESIELSQLESTDENDKDLIIENTNKSDVINYLKKIYDSKKDDKKLYYLAKIEDETQLESGNLNGIQWKELVSLCKLTEPNIFDSINDSKLRNKYVTISVYILLNLLICVSFIKLYVAQFNKNKVYNNDVFDSKRQNELINEIQSFYEEIWGRENRQESDELNGGGGLPKIIKYYLNQITSQIIQKYFNSEGKIKSVIHNCLSKIASFVILSNMYDKESDMLGLLFFPDPAMLPKFRKMEGFSLFQNDDRIIYKYKGFWNSFQMEGHTLKDFTVKRPLGDTKQEIHESGKSEEYYKGIKELNFLLSGNKVVGDIGPSKIILTSTINSGFIDATSDEEQTQVNVYTMFEYNVKENIITIRSFQAQLTVSDNNEIIEYKKNSEEPVVIKSGSLDNVEDFLEEIKNNETSGLSKLKFVDSLKKKMQKGDKDDSYYLLGFTSNEDYKDSILENLKPQVPQGGGYKQKGGLASEEVKEWGNGLIQKIKGISNDKQEVEKKEEKNPQSKIISEIGQLKEVVKQKSNDVTKKINGILEKEHSYMKKAGKGGYTRRRKMKRGIKNITLKR